MMKVVVSSILAISALGYLAAQERSSLRAHSGPAAPKPAAAKPNFFGLAPAPDAAAVARDKRYTWPVADSVTAPQAKAATPALTWSDRYRVARRRLRQRSRPGDLEWPSSKGHAEFTMTDEQIKDIAAYLLSLSPRNGEPRRVQDSGRGDR